MAKYCGNCGRELPDEALFCPDCGREYIPRHKADHYSNDSSKKEFNGPFDDFNNRSSKNPFESSSRNAESSSKSSSNDSNDSERFPLKKVCCAVLILLLLFSIISYFAGVGVNSNAYDTSPIEDSSNNISSTDYLYDRNYSAHGNYDEGRGSIDSNEPYNMSIDNTAYISGTGEARLIDSNYSYDLVGEDFNITAYETYFINVDDEDWYVLTVFQCKFDTPAQSQVYVTEYVEENPIIIYNAKGNDVGYVVMIPDSSSNSTYKNTFFLEKLFHYEEE